MGRYRDRRARYLSGWPRDFATSAYLAGMIFRPKRRISGMGVDSLAVLILYGIGIVGLFAIATSGHHG